MRKLILFLAVLVLASCATKLDEVVSEKFPDGSPKRVDYYSGEEPGKYLAKSIFYYENGQKRVEGNYNAEGKKHGKWAYWYENGNKWSEGFFTEGLDDKKRTTWHENGKLHFTGRLENGKRIGIWKFYDENGNVTKELDYNKENPEFQ